MCEWAIAAMPWIDHHSGKGQFHSRPVSDFRKCRKEAALRKQQDFTRAAKALASTGKPGRIIARLQTGELEIIIDQDLANPPDPDDDWSDDD